MSNKVTDLKSESTSPSAWSVSPSPPIGIVAWLSGHRRNLTVQAPALMVREQWFLDAMEDAPDYLSVWSKLQDGGPSNQNLVSSWVTCQFEAMSRRNGDRFLIRSGRSTLLRLFTSLVCLCRAACLSHGIYRVTGGHTHVRDCTQYDDHSIA